MQGSEVTELVLFVSTMCVWGVYVLLYFIRHRFIKAGDYFKTRKHGLMLDIWSNAMRTRKVWALDVMAKAQNASGEGLMAIQQMRNLILSASLLVMGISQISGRLMTIMVTSDNLQTIDYLVSKDPISGANYWAPAEARVAAALGATLFCLICFGQTARLAIHVGFSIRVRAICPHDEDDTSMPLEEEVITMVRRSEMYFTLGLRSMYLFVGLCFWMLGVTAFIVSSYTVLLMLVISDQLWFKRPDTMSSRIQSNSNDDYCRKDRQGAGAVDGGVGEGGEHITAVDAREILDDGF